MKMTMEIQNNEKREEKRPLFKRILAYIIDIVIVTYISGLFASMEYINPYIEEYNAAYNEYYSILVNPSSNVEALSNETLTNLTYDLTYYGSITTLITVAVTILYFVLFQYFNKGKTIGKAIFKIKIVDDKNNRPSLFQLFLRSLIVNSVFANLLTGILVLFTKKEFFINIYTYIQFIDIGLILATISMMVVRDDRRGLHDIIAKTNVVNREQSVIINEIKEAKVVEKDNIDEKNNVAEVVEKKKKTAKKTSSNESGKKAKKNENSNRK